MQQECKLFVFILMVLCVFRIGFIAVMHSFLGEVTWLDIGTAIYYGFRISLKSAGTLMLPPLVCCTVLCLFGAKKKLNRIRFYLGVAYVVILSFLFHARIPYYQEFHMAFSQLLFNTLHDDVSAILHTVIAQYNLPVRALLAAVTAWLLCRLLRCCLASRTYTLPRLPKWYQNIALRTGLIISIYYLAIFIRFGGTMTYAYDIDWENSGVTRDQLLNEAILDDVQALYRAYALHERIASSTGIAMNPGSLKRFWTLSGWPTGAIRST